MIKQIKNLFRTKERHVMAYRGFAIEVEYYKENEKVVESIARGVLEDIVTETSMESINFYKLPVGMKITRLS